MSDAETPAPESGTLDPAYFSKVSPLPEQPLYPIHGAVWLDRERDQVFKYDARLGQWVPVDLTKPQRGERERLPARRASDRQKVVLDTFKCYVDVGRYADGRPGEIWLDASKSGAELRGLYAAIAHAVSIGLQHGVPMSEFVTTFTHVRYGPNGPMQPDPDDENPVDLGDATSPIDAIFRIIAAQCGIQIPEPPKEPR